LQVALAGGLFLPATGMAGRLAAKLVGALPATVKPALPNC
jgi:hypothetical protein